MSNTAGRHLRQAWHALMAAFAVGVAWFGWRSLELRDEALEYRSDAWLDFTPFFSYFLGVLGLGVAVVMAISIFVAELIDLTNEWHTGRAARFGIALSVLWIPVFGLGALLGSVASLLTVAPLVGIFAIGIHDLSSATQLSESVNTSTFHAD